MIKLLINFYLLYKNINKEKEINLFSFKNISNEKVNDLNNNIENYKIWFFKSNKLNTSKVKYGYFVKKANKKKKNYEQQLLYYKIKL